jgi:hypothetical protein
MSLLYSLAICYRENELIFLDSRPDPDSFRRLLPFLNTFLRLVHHAEYKEQLLDTMMQYMQQIRYLAPINRRVVMAASRLFQSAQISTPGLKNSLLALHMAYTRRYASLEDLQALYRVEPVPADRFLMDDNIRERMQKFIDTQREEMQRLSGSLAAFTEIRIDKPDLMEEVACHDLYTLQQGDPHPVVEQGKTTAQMARALIQYDLVAFIEKAVSGFVYQVEPLLTGRLPGPVGPLRPFDAHLFSGDLEKISTLLEALRNYRTKFNKLTVTHDFYKNFLNSPDRLGSFSDAERSICLAFRTLGGHLYQLALKLNAMLTRDAGLASDDPDDGETARLIRHDSLVIPAPGFFAGKTVKAALHAVVQIAVGAALILGEPTLQVFLARYPALLDRLDELRRVLGRFPATG